MPNDAALGRGFRYTVVLIDVVTLWTWETAELANLETNLTKLEKLAPKARKLLGCYPSVLSHSFM